MTEKNQYKNNFSLESRSYKTQGNSYKDRYVKDVICPECGGNSAYRDDMHTVVSYKCMKRFCRHQWYYKPTEEEMKEKIRIRKAAMKEAEAE